MAGPRCGPFSFVGIMRAMPFDFDSIGVPFRMQPGLRRLSDGAQQLTPNQIGDAALREKLAALSGSAEQALVCAPDFDAAPALRALSEQASREHPDAFEIRGPDHFVAPHLGWSLRDGEPFGEGATEIGDCLRALPVAWRHTALLCLAFAEDFAVIDGATARIPWLAVCLPSHWAPEDKVGRHFAEVHSPVADNQMLLAASEHLARLVSGDDRWERFVWTLTPRQTLDNHPKRCGARHWLPDADMTGIAAQARLRTEHQTFIPLPALRQAIFTIHVEIQNLSDVFPLPEQARRLHDALESMSPAVLAYRGLTGARDRLLAWLARRASLNSA